jgi:hypothetical protein
VWAPIQLLAAAAAYFRGERVAVSPRLVDLGAAAAGDIREVTVDVHNWTEGPIRLIGGTADCSCTVLENLPLDIPARERRSATVSIRMPAKPGIFTRKAGFLIDDNGMRRINFQLTGRVFNVGNSSKCHRPASAFASLMVPTALYWSNDENGDMRHRRAIVPR